MLLLRADDPLAEGEGVTAAQLAKRSAYFSRQQVSLAHETNPLRNWLGHYRGHTRQVGTLDLVRNAGAMVAAGDVGFSINSSIPDSAHLAAVSLALDLGVSIDAVNDQGNSAMHIAAHGGWSAVVKELAARGAALNTKNKAGNTPLRIADGVIVIMMTYSHPKTAELLRSLGATY